MKITSIRATPVNIPVEAPYFAGYGVQPGFTHTILEVETDQGLTGLGEAPGPAAAQIIDSRIAPLLEGRSAIDINGALAACVQVLRGVQSTADLATLAAFGGIEIALWDIRGKAWGERVCDLLGGAVREEVPFSDYFAYRQARNGIGGETTPEAVADYCLKLREEHGSHVFEGKVSETDPRRSIALVETLRDRLGEDAVIRIDSNQAYTVATARMLAPAFEAARIDNWEDPVGSYEETARLRPHTRLSLSSHNTDIAKAAALGVPDALVTSIAGHGGFLGTQRFVAACEALGIDFWCYSGDSGIQSAAYLHLCAATEWIRRPNQSLFHMQPLDVIEEGPFRPKSNLLPVPRGPGLGVTLDRDKLRHAHELFLRDGPVNKLTHPEAPGRIRRLPIA